MRRMYSQTELEKLVKDVFLADVESGEIDFAGIMTDALENMDVVAKSVSAESISGDSIIENMSGYSMTKVETLNWNAIYVGACKNGNKLTFVIFGTYTFATGDSASDILTFTIPEEVGNKLSPYTIGAETKMLDQKVIPFYATRLGFTNIKLETLKVSNTSIKVDFADVGGLTNGTTYTFRYEVTFLLSENLAE